MRRGGPLAWLWPAWMVTLAGCTEIGSEPVPEEREAAELELSVEEDLIVEGEDTGASVRLLDSEGRAFERLPPWMRMETSDRDVLRVVDGEALRGYGAGRATVRARANHLSEEREVRVNPAELDLSVRSVLMNQSAQDLEGSVPLVAGEPAYLRVFLEGDAVNFFEPSVRVRLYHGQALQETLTLDPTSEGIPREADDDTWEGSWGAPLPAHLLTPDLEAVVEVDPEGLVPLPEHRTRVRHPVEGRKRFEVRDLPPLRMTLVPVEQPDGDGGTIPSALDAANADSYLPPFLRMFPVTEDADIQVREPFQVSQRAADVDSWVDGLQELRALRLSEAEDRYYYGVLRRTEGPIAGIAYIGLPTAMGHDALSQGAAETLAHELGHNMGLEHAPCGGPAGVDDDFPQEDGSIGSAGIDVVAGTLHPSETPDIMSYCRPPWIGPYMYGKALDFRYGEEPLAGSAGSREGDGDGEALARETGSDTRNGEPSPGALVVFGSVHAGEIRVSPAFQADAPPALPEGDGDHLLEGFDSSGRALFRFPFQPVPVEDAGAEVSGFAFVLPPELARPAELAEIRVSGPAGTGTRASTVADGERPSPQAATTPGPGGAREDPALSPPANVRAERTGEGVRLEWDATARPLVVVRDPVTGRALSYGRGGEATLPGDHRELVVDVSHGTGSEAIRLDVEGAGPP